MGDPKWKTHSRLVYRHLVEGVRVSGRLSDNLISEGLLDYEKASIIDKVQPNTEEQKARCMVQLLSKEPKSYDRFCSVLRKVGYKDLANKLRPRGAKSSPKGQRRNTSTSENQQTRQSKSKRRRANEPATEAKDSDSEDEPVVTTASKKTKITSQAKKEKGLDMAARITDKQIMAIANAARTQWEDIGSNLGFERDELAGYEYKFRDDLHKRLRHILFAWKAREVDPTVGKVLQACKDAKVGADAEKSILSLLD